MRQVFIQTNKKTDALKECPWTSEIKKCLVAMIRLGLNLD